MQTRQTGKGRPGGRCVEYDSDCSASVRYFVSWCRVAGVKVELVLVVSGFWDEESDRRPLGGRILAGKSWDRRLSATGQSSRSGAGEYKRDSTEG